MQNVIKIASSSNDDVLSGMADNVIEFVTDMRTDFETEIHYFGTSFLLEMKFAEDVSKLAIVLKLVFSGLEVELR